jgi:hypothetical protein
MTAPRPSWRDTLRVAADVALLGIVVTAAALPVVTAGAAAAAASAAMHHFQRYDRWPAAAGTWRVFRRHLLPGAAAVAAGLAAAGLLVVNVLALRSGVVPGGGVLTALTGALLVAAAGYAGLLLVALGADPDRGWRAAARAASRARPATVAATAGVVLLAAVIGTLGHPVLAPAVAGYALFALHAVAGRTGADEVAVRS